MSKKPEIIIAEALEQYLPTKILLLFSGGHDSLCSTRLSAYILKKMGLDFTVYHGDTTIGIPQTQEYVKQVCEQFGWELAIRRAPNGETYDEIVAKYGFPGPTKSSHQFMYRRLKERALRAYVTHECKSSPQKRENVLLISGIRKQESKIRMGYTWESHKEDSRIWCNPLFYWSAKRCENYMLEQKLPRNPVKDQICISGECLCGAFAGKEEWLEIKKAYPEVAKRIEDLHELAKANGFPWPWASGPNEWLKNHPPGTIDMFTGETNPMMMCVGCESKRSE